MLWGPTGTGKSTTVRRCAAVRFGTIDAVYELRYPKHSDLLRWEGFDPTVHKAVLLEEFTGQIDIDDLKKLLDKWPIRVRTFGGDRVIRPVEFWFTSNVAPHLWWNGRYKDVYDQHRRALERRITRSVLLGNSTTPNRYAESDKFCAWYADRYGPDATDQPEPEEGAEPEPPQDGEAMIM